MRSLALTALVVLVAGCGNYSNEDVAFLNALPSQQALQLDVPQGSQAALSRTASLYAGTVVTAQDLNSAAEGVIALVDRIRTLAPSARTADSRTWGPFADKNPSFEVQVVITRDGDTFNYVFEERRVGDPSFTPVLTGSFTGTSALAGHGAIDYEQRQLGTLGNPPTDPSVAAITFSYVNDQEPRTVTTTVTRSDATQSGFANLTYVYSSGADQGTLDFDLTGPAGLQTFDLRVQSRWLSDGGRGSAHGLGTLTGGFGAPGGNAVDASQCWDDAFQETYYDSWRGPQLLDGGVLHLAPGLDCDAGAGFDCPRGDSSACPF